MFDVVDVDDMFVMSALKRFPVGKSGESFKQMEKALNSRLKL